MLSPEYINQYLELRKYNLIGKLFAESGAFRLAPVDALPGLEHQISDPISESNLIKLLDNLSLLILRIGPRSEQLYETSQIKVS